MNLGVFMHSELVNILPSEQLSKVPSIDKITAVVECKGDIR